MEQACWHSGVGAAMGFCVVDWGGKDLGTTRVSGFWERSRGIWWWLRGLGALCAPRGWDYSPATPAHPFGAALRAFLRCARWRRDPRPGSKAFSPQRTQGSQRKTVFLSEPCVLCGKSVFNDVGYRAASDAPTGRPRLQQLPSNPRRTQLTPARLPSPAFAVGF